MTIEHVGEKGGVMVISSYRFKSHGSTFAILFGLLEKKGLLQLKLRFALPGRVKGAGLPFDP